MRARSLRSFRLASTLALAAASFVPERADAAPALRVQVEQNGDFLIIGNTLGFECAAGTPAPVVGTIGSTACSGQLTSNTADSAPDLLWRSDAPANGQALADTSITPALARSTAVLNVPPGATVTHAYLYWASQSATNVADTSVVLDRPGAGGFVQTVTAVQSFVPGANNSYQSVADVSALVQANGSGAYRVSGIEVPALVDVNNNNLFGGWSMVVFYALPSAPRRNLAIFDGLDVVSIGNNQAATVSGFLVPAAGFSGKLGVIAYEGDNTITGDQLIFSGAPLSNAQNPINNFFNATRSNLGVAVSVTGDLPQLTGTAQSLAGMDLDIVDVTAQLTAGQTSAVIQATSTGDVFYLGAFVTSIASFAPDFATSTKSVIDLNGGAVLPGDVLQYTIAVGNSGNDTAVNVSISDPLPSGVTYVPGSLAVTSGANTGAKTDAAGDDQAEYDVAMRAIQFRVGTGANATQGGQMPIGATTTVQFRVTVNAGFSGTVANQANVTASGLLGSPQRSSPTDGDASAPGAQPTSIIVDQCVTDAECAVPTGSCLTTASPHVCVACLDNSACSGTTPLCSVGTHICIACAGDGAPSCIDPTHPACQPDGSCGECTASNGSLCTGTRPVCVISTGICGCNSDSDCGSATSGMVCAGSMCQSGCSVAAGRNDCAATQWCNDRSGGVGTCIAQCGSDTDCTTAPLLHCDTGHTPAFCLECVADSNCATGEICNAVDHRCAECTSTQLTNCSAGGHGAACLASNTCGCLADGDCGNATSGRICNQTMHLCAAGCSETGGNGCPSGQMCTAGACVMIVIDAGGDAATDASGADVSDVSQSDGAPRDSAAVDARTDGSSDGGTGVTRPGCGCAVPGNAAPASTPWIVLSIASVASALARRRRRPANRVCGSAAK